MTVANMDKRPTSAAKIDGVLLNSGGTFNKVPLGSAQTKNEQKIEGNCAYWCKCKKCERCSKCDYVVNGLRRFERRDEKLICENCLWDQQKVRKKCLGCGNNFADSPSENSDYCRNCEINNKRHILKESRCSEVLVNFVLYNRTYSSTWSQK